ncbi:ribonuclease H [Senna tora]|uniref:Ribonuclease H n=1 Tax=Senna tora TaxID=362788 RepID=A0A834XDK5_9FABA|nr:ribonuclease H [Senna tora]
MKEEARRGRQPTKWSSSGYNFYNQKGGLSLGARDQTGKGTKAANYKVNTRFHMWSAIIDDINSMLAANPSFKINYILREANQSANFMAKLGSRSDERGVIRDSPPPGIDHLLLADRISTLFARD